MWQKFLSGSWIRSPHSGHPSPKFPVDIARSGEIWFARFLFILFS